MCAAQSCTLWSSPVNYIHEAAKEMGFFLRLLAEICPIHGYKHLSGVSNGG